MIWSEEALRALPEDELCQKILIPLFEAMGYNDVEYHHGGALEQGKDIVMWREEPPKARVNYAVVVKAKKITGAASRGTHEVLMQIKQSLGSSYTDKRTLEEQKIHQCYLVSSREIKKEGTNSFQSLLEQEGLVGRVFIIDGVDLWRHVRKHLSEYVIHSQLESAYEALKSPHPDYDFEVTLRPGERQFGLVPKHPNAEPIRVSFSPSFPETPEGQRKREEFDKHVKTGTGVELDQDNVRFEDLPEPLRMLFPFAEGQPYTIVMGPSQIVKPLPMSLTAKGDDGSSFTLPWIEFRQGRGGTDEMIVSNEGQMIPLKVSLELSHQTHRVGINYTFRFAGQSIYWLVQATQFQKVLAGGAHVFLRDLGTGVVLPHFRVLPGQAKDWGEEFSQIAHKILEIQDYIKIPILVPAREFFLDKDVYQMNLIYHVLRTGTLPADAIPKYLNARFLNSRTRAKEFLSTLERKPAPDFLYRKSNYFEAFFDQEIPLGPIEYKIPEARLSVEDLQKLRRCVAGKTRSKDINMRLMPKEGSSIEVTFAKWPKGKDEDDPVAIVQEGSTPAKSKNRDKRKK